MSGARIMLAGGSSGSGKTMICCALLYLFRERGMQAAAFKCGPDYIDPLCHSHITGRAGRNLDSFFMSEEMLRMALACGSEGADIAVIEGAMGYYDGMGMGTEGSCSQIAEKTDTPVLLVLDCQGRAASVLAELRGFLHYQQAGQRIRGVILNRMSERLYAEAAPLVEAEGVIPCGYVPKQEALSWDSRHLGLVLPENSQAFEKKMRKAAQILKKTLEIENILCIAEEAGNKRSSFQQTANHNCWDERKNAEGIESPLSQQMAKHSGMDNRKIADESVYLPTIAVAKDEAFCFYYTENIEYLEKAGCRIRYFSPIRDRKLPACDGLILPGGYPELYAAQLQDNEEMREAIRKHIAGGLPTIAECGGYLYLHRTLTDKEGKCYRMAGALPVDCAYQGMSRSFGYIRIYSEKDGLLGKAGLLGHGHEFHYFASRKHAEEEGELRMVKPDGSRSWKGGIMTESLYAGFPHFFLPGEGSAGEAFVRRVREYAAKRG